MPARFSDEPWKIILLIVHLFSPFYFYFLLFGCVFVYAWLYRDFVFFEIELNFLLYLHFYDSKIVVAIVFCFCKSLLCFKKKDDSITATVTTVSTPPSPHLNQQQMYPVPQGGYFPSNPENHQHTAQPSKQQQQYPTTSSPYPEAVPYKPSSGPQQQYPHRDTNGPPPYTDKVQASAPPM